MRAVLGGRDALGSAPITVGPHALIYHNDPSGEAGKRDQGRTKVNFARIPGRSKVNQNDMYQCMSSAGQNEGRPIWVGFDHFDESELFARQSQSNAELIGTLSEP